MNHRRARRAAAAVLTGVALVALAACGQAAEPPEATSADDPVRTSGPEPGSAGGGVSGSTGSDTPTSNGGDVAQFPSLAQWPAAGCDSRSVVSVDYGRMPPGFDTPEEAVENSPAAGLPEGVLTMAPDSGKGPAQVWIVDPGTNEIQAQVSVFRGPDGWFVDGVMTCS
jgi:hypothetical protein